MISVCVTVDNRSKVEYAGRTLELFPNLVRPLVSAAGRSDEEVELCVSDWGSTDWPLAEWLPGLWKGRLSLREVGQFEKFSVGHGKNVAAEHANGDTLLFVDGDMLVPVNYFAIVKQVCGGGEAFYPLYWRNDNPKAAFWTRADWHRAIGRFGYWGMGYGNAAMPKKVFEQAGGWPALFSYGREDTTFHQTVRSYYPTRRYRIRGLVHQWHPESPEEIEIVKG
jgi:glycosyltransferase involved in cell wall biosynthesis